MAITTRLARDSDKIPVLEFCKSTFSWGDYIDQAWDDWIKDRKGRLYVSSLDEGKAAIAVSHVALCPFRKSIWLEGVRVMPSYRNKGIASAMIETMLDYGAKKGAVEALGIVAANNYPSQQMMEKLGFSVISDWSYFGTDQKISGAKSQSRLATSRDIDDIMRYLENSEVFRLCSRRYVNAWRWYKIDKRVLSAFVARKRLIITGSPISGLALLNLDGYWNRRNLIQIVYLDVKSPDALASIVNFALDLYTYGGFNRFQIFCHQRLTAAIKQFGMTESEEFLLYQKEIRKAKKK